ncbi:MAG: ATP-binding protein [Sulfuricella sp.]|nr:ATP-binding protein [Sulfuricella sp.]
MESEAIEPRAFDREYDLAELLGGAPLGRLAPIFSALLGEYRLVSAGGQRLLGRAEPFAEPRRAAVRHDLEPLGFLESEQADEARLAAAAEMVGLLLHLSARYHMAAELHIETVREDYAALQRKHAALQESEARYKALSEKLEERVKEQVGTIEAAQRQLYQAEKLASIGQLAAGVAHEINNPIGFIRSNLSTARQYLSKLEPLAVPVKAGDMARCRAVWEQGDLDFALEDFASLLRESLDGADRVTRIVADLKGFSNVDKAEEEVVDLNDNIRFAANVVAGQIKGKAELVLELGALPRILCLPGHLNQVLLNLLINAAQAIQDKGRITMQSEAAGGEIRIRVSDTGCGIPAGNLERIFEPFFTTREVGSGTGLGLTVSRDIVQAHGGRIEVESEEGTGTTFTVILPVD